MTRGTNTRRLLGLLAIAAAAAFALLAFAGGASAHVDSTAAAAGSATDCNGNGVPNTSEPAWGNRDDDGDGVCNAVDNCPTEPNADQAMAANGSGVACQMQAITVPGPHLTYSGATTTLKAIARYGANQYMWDFGDGTASTTWMPIADPYNLGINHAYTGTAGQTFTATVSVRNSGNPAVVATAAYSVEIVGATNLQDRAQLDNRARMAVDQSLWYLHVSESRSSYADGVPGYRQPYGLWNQGGLYSNAVCDAVLAFETAGHRPGSAYDTDPYVEDVQRGLNYTLANASAMPIGPRFDTFGGVADVNGNGKGIVFTDSGNMNTATGSCLTALGDTQAPTTIAATGKPDVYGRPYADVGQDAAEWLAWTQNGTSRGWATGAWGYNVQDGSAGDPGSQLYPVLGLQADSDGLGVTLPNYVRALMPYWLAYSQHTAQDASNGGWGYSSPNDYLIASSTGAGINEELFIGNSTSHPAIQRGLGFLYRNWGANNAGPWGCWTANVGSSDAMYAVAQAMRTGGLTRITDYDYTRNIQTANSFDWFHTLAGQSQPGYGNDLVQRQQSDGSWADGAGCVANGGATTTAHDTIVLLDGLAVSTPPPVANPGGPYSGTPGQTIQLDGTGSSGSSLAYAWDLNADGLYNDSVAAQPNFTIPASATAGTTYSVCLKVTNGGGTSSPACATVTVKAVQPPICAIVAPTQVLSNTGGAMTITVDGSRSSDPGGAPLTYRWNSVDGPTFADPAAAITTQTGNFAHAGASVSWTDTLTVSNTMLSASCTATITIVDNLPPVLTVPGNLTVEAGPNAAANINAWLASASASDDAASVPVSLANDFAGIPPVGSPLRVTWTATNPYDSAITAQGSAILTVVDTTPPVLVLPADITATSTTVSYTATATDFVDGNVPVTCDPPSGSTFPAGTTTVTCHATDNAGNTASGTFRVTVTDATPPVITPTVTGPLGNDNWYIGDVHVSWSVTDPDSAVGSENGCDDASVITDTTGTTITCSATSAGGPASASVTVKRDTHAPSIAATRAPAANGAGWNNSAVTASFSCSDGSGSGVATCPAPAVFGPGVAQSRTVSATDVAGNTGSFTVSDVNVDEESPTLAGSATDSPNAHGWYRNDVTIHWTCADTGGSGLAAGACPHDTVIGGEGRGLAATENVTDVAGNVTTAKSTTVKIDRTAPLTAASAPSGWTNAGVTIALTATDNLSGADTTSWTLDGGAVQTGTSIPITDEGVHTITFWSADNAGNLEAQHTATVSIDRTSPTITHTVAPTPNAAGWNNTNVTVSFMCDDALSKIASCTLDQLLSTEGAAQAVVGKAVDNAGNSTVDTVRVSIDKTNPTIVAAADRAPNANGWYKADVIVGFTCNDALSGIVSCPAPVTVKEGAAQFVTRSTTDVAGNTASAGVAGLNVDETAPVVAFTGGGTYAVDDTVTINCTATDALSGIASTTCAPVTGPAWTFGLGTTTRSATATDRAGNVGTGSVQITVGVTCSSLKTLIGQWVTNAGVAAGLSAKVDAICSAPNANAKSGQLGAFDNQVDAQTGKSVTAARAKLLKQLAASL